MDQSDIKTLLRLASSHDDLEDAEIDAIRRVAATAGLDPIEFTPHEKRRFYPHAYVEWEAPAHWKNPRQRCGVCGGWGVIGAPKSDPIHVDPLFR